MKRIAVGISVVVVFIIMYIIATPYITVYQIKSAAENYDGEALSEYIDFPSVRQSLKDQINVIFAKEMVQDKDIKDNPFAALGIAFGAMIVNKMVDTFVTPAGIIQMMKGEKPKLDLNNNSTKLIKPNKDTTRKPWDNITMGYESINKFVVKVNDEKGDKIKFIFRRKGIGWKLAQIVIPME